MYVKKKQSKKGSCVLNGIYTLFHIKASSMGFLFFILHFSF